MRPTSVLATLTGRDRPGVTAAFFAALAAHDVDVRDVEQVVIRERLILTVLVDLRGDPASLRNSVTRAANALGMECEIALAEDFDRTGGPPVPVMPGSRSHVIVMGYPLRAGAIGHIAQLITNTGSNIETVTQLSTAPVSALELVVRTPDDGARLRTVLIEAAPDTGVDLAVEHARLRRSAKRLVGVGLDVLVDSPDPLELLAERTGAAAQSAAIRARTEAGELTAPESVRARVGLLAGCPIEALDEVRCKVRPVAGAARFVRILHRLGYSVAAAGAGVATLVRPTVADLGAELIAATELEIADGRLTGRLIGEPAHGSTAAQALARYADQQGVPRSQCVTVGDGRDARELVLAGGLSIAVVARPGLRYLDSVLFVLGVPEDDISS
jgi:phosphoserine phosphatase